MLTGIQLVHWIITVALTDQSIPTEHIVDVMRKNNLTSTHLTNYVNDDNFWPLHPDDANIPAKDEKYFINLRNPEQRRALKEKRTQLLTAIETRFYTGHKFNEWMI